MAARDHFRTHARRRVDLAATLRVHEAEPRPTLDEPEKAEGRPTLDGTERLELGQMFEPRAKGPRLTLEWSSKAERPLAAEEPAKAEPRSASEPSSPAGREERPPQGVRIRDLGLGGAGIEIPEASGERAQAGASSIEREAPVTIEVLAPSLWDPLILSGRIAWIKRVSPGRGMRAGVRFEHREAAALYTLFRLLGTYVHDA